MKNTLFRSAGVLAAALLVAGTANAAGLLTAKNGMTIYVFDKDAGGVPTCYDACAVKWPPYLANKNEKMMKNWTEVKRTDGKLQWAYNAKPLYFFMGDKKKGDKTGDGVGGVWHAISE